MEENVDVDIVKILKEAFEPLICHMVDFPEDVNINIQKSEYNTVFVYITARKVDVGKIIGREGRHAGPIRILVSSIGSKFKFRTIVEINPNED